MGLHGSSLADYVALMKPQLPSRTKEVQRSAGGGPRPGRADRSRDADHA
jgi:hypothetical protein